MPTTVLVLDGILGSPVNLNGASVSSLNAQDAAWATASANNVNSNVQVSFPSPPGGLRTGAGLQTVTVQSRKNSTNSGTPSYVIEVRETAPGGVLATSPSINVTSTTGQVNTFTWDASLLADLSGADFEVRVVSSAAGGSPTTRNSVDWGYIAWTADYSLAELPVTGGSFFPFFN